MHSDTHHLVGSGGIPFSASFRVIVPIPAKSLNPKQSRTAPRISVVFGWRFSLGGRMTICTTEAVRNSRRGPRRLLARRSRANET